MQITVRMKHDTQVRRMLRDIGERSPFAVSFAANKVADAVQAEVRTSLSSRFTLRRKTFIEQTIYRNKQTDFAHKDRRPIQAIVRVNPERDLLVPHEEGGQKGPRSGQHVAIPTARARPTFGQIVPKRLRVSTLRTSANVRKVVTAKGALLVRDIKGRGKAARGARSEILYVLKRSVPLKPRLGFHATANRMIDKHAVPQMLEAIETALRAALRAS